MATSYSPSNLHLSVGKFWSSDWNGDRGLVRLAIIPHRLSPPVSSWCYQHFVTLGTRLSCLLIIIANFEFKLWLLISRFAIGRLATANWNLFVVLADFRLSLSFASNDDRNPNQQIQQIDLTTRFWVIRTHYVRIMKTYSELLWLRFIANFVTWSDPMELKSLKIFFFE